MTFVIFSIYLFVMIGRPQEYLSFLETLRPAFVLGILSALAIITSKRLERLHEVLELSESRKYLFFYLIMVIGVPFALYRRETLEFSLLTYSNNILFFFIFILANDSFEKLKKSIFIIILSIFIYGIVCAKQGELEQGRFYFGNMFDPNDLAYLFVSLLPMPLYYLIHSVGRMKKGLGLFTIGVSILIIMLTGSRAGIITLLVTFFAIMYTIKIPATKKIFLICILIGIFIANYDKINMERYSTILEIGEDYNVTAEMGRLTVWKRGLQIISENPLTGVGATNFPGAIGSIRLTLDLPQARWQPAHNSFLQIACELGLIGFIVFVSMVYGCLKNFSAISRGRSEGEFDEELRTIARVMLISTIATSVAGAFLTQGYSILFTLIFAFSGTLKLLNSRVKEAV